LPLVDELLLAVEHALSVFISFIAPAEQVEQAVGDEESDLGGW
jgi:hypothetical protein